MHNFLNLKNGLVCCRTQKVSTEDIAAGKHTCSAFSSKFIVGATEFSVKISELLLLLLLPA